MKEVCRDCKYAKEKSGRSCYCTKYGIIIGYGKIHCVSYEPKRGSDRVEVHERKDND